MDYDKSNRDRKVDSRSFRMVMSGKGTLRLHNDLMEKARQKRREQDALLARRGKQTPL
jgi:hypothetical protein